MHDDTDVPEEMVPITDEESEAVESSGSAKRSKAAEEAASLAEEFLQQLSRGDAGLGAEDELEIALPSEAFGEADDSTAAPDSEDVPDAGSSSKAERRAKTLEMVATLEKRALEAEARVAELTKEVEEHYQARLRLQADFENHRKRVVREREEQARYAHEDLLKEILPSLDNLERAVQHAEAEAEAEAEGASGAFVDGVKITMNQCLHILSRFGVIPFESVGEVFDPQLHDAMSQVATAELPPNHVVSQFVKGYHYHERLLRPAMVSVSMAVEEEAAPAPETESELVDDDSGKLEDLATDVAPSALDEGPVTEVVTGEGANAADDDEDDE